MSPIPNRRLVGLFCCVNRSLLTLAHTAHRAPQLYTVAIKAGATTLNVPDTVGFTTPTEFRDLIMYLRTHVEGIEDVTLSVHGHNDLGMAVCISCMNIYV